MTHEVMQQVVTPQNTFWINTKLKTDTLEIAISDINGRTGFHRLVGISKAVLLEHYYYVLRVMAKIFRPSMSETLFLSKLQFLSATLFSQWS